jgi:hypothetical protein
MDIYSKETKHTSHEKAAYLTKFHSTVQVQRTEYKIQNTETTKHENKEKATASSYTTKWFNILNRGHRNIMVTS